MNTQETISALLSSLGITLTASAPTVNDELQFQFAIQVSRNGKAFYSGPYSMGYGHLKFPKHANQFYHYTDAEASIIESAARKAFPDLKAYKNQDFVRGLLLKLATKQKLTPSLADVMHSLLLDARCGDNSFKDFCAELGCDDDSISAKETWEACNKTHYAMRDAFTTEERAKLDEAFQDY